MAGADPGLVGLLRCPACRSDLAWSASAASCGACGIDYPVTDGIIVLVAPGSDIHDDELDHDHGAHNRKQAAWFDQASHEAFEVSRPRGAPKLYGWLLRRKAHLALEPAKGQLAGRIGLVVCGGSGMDAEFLSERGMRVITSDISLGAARRAGERGRRHGIPLLSIVASAEQLPFADGAIDLVYVHDGLHHLADPLPAMDEMARVSGRWVAITEPARAAATRIAVRLGWALEREPAGNVVVRLDPADVAGRLEDHGFTTVRSRRYAMFYRHEPGAVMAFLSLAGLRHLAMAALRILESASGRVGNKLVVVARRPTAREGQPK
jgi:SAM-dependent methyltransferase/uncharacterized protein YbaR (Trm112 family)